MSAAGKPIIRQGGSRPIFLSYVWGLGCAFLGGTFVNRVMQPEKMPRYAHLFGGEPKATKSAEEVAATAVPSQDAPTS